MFKNYVFDLYGTLVDIRTNEQKQYLWKKMAEFYGMYGAIYTPSELKKSFFKICNMEEEKMYEESKGKAGIEKEDDIEIKIERVFLKLYQERGVSVNKEIAVCTGQMFRVLSTKYENLYEGVKDLLDNLKAAGKKVYLLSNAQYIFTRYEMSMLGIDRYFDGIVISSEEGCKKPSKAFYSKIIERYALDVKESIMIGNDQIADIQGAKRVGMKTAYVHTEISPEYVQEQCPADFLYLDGDIRNVNKLIK